MDFGTQFGVFMLLAVLIVLGRWLKSWGQRMVERRAERDAPDPAVERALEQEQLVLDDTPDGPVPFGYKTSWAAVKCGSPDEVINALQLSGRRAGWTTGLAAAMRGQGVFVSPPAWMVMCWLSDRSCGRRLRKRSPRYSSLPATGAATTIPGRCTGMGASSGSLRMKVIGSWLMMVL